MKNKKLLNYSDYLQLEKILSGQELMSAKRGTPAHDEMLFIIVHQVYELWFKQILHELDSVITIFKKESIVESEISFVVLRLQRIIEIQKILIDQIRVLETMTAMDFLEFRDDLFPSSGFQSAQFRLMENKLGLLNDHRIMYGGKDYTSVIKEQEKSAVKSSEEEKSLFELLESWLERTPFLSFKGSLLYIPSTFVALIINLQSNSDALKVAAVSVEKNGLPVPAANITILFLSKCLIALLLI
mgnify:CR=1 FL=1